MKKALFRITMTGMLTLALMAATETARAQEPLVVNIPFAFAAGRMALPPGEYRIQKVAYDSSILLIERTEHAAGTVVMSLAAEANAKQAQPKLVFHRYDNRYFLSQIWIAGSTRQRAHEIAARKGAELGSAQRNAGPGHDRCPPPRTQALVPFQNGGRQPYGNPEKLLPDSRLFLT